jgi:translation initiation factor 3 subunit B
LCFKVDRHARKAKSKKPTSTNLEIFRMREKETPIESIELKGEPIIRSVVTMLAELL